MYIDDYLKIKNKAKKNKFKLFLKKLLLLIIIFLFVVIGIKKDDNVRLWIKSNILSRNLPFTEIKKFYTKYFGTILPFDDLVLTESVFSEKIEYVDINKYKDGVVLTVSNNYLVPVQYSGVVVYVGEKEGYGNTIIVEGDDIVIWYCNVTSNIKLYDEIKKGEYLGETINDKLYLVFQKEGKVVDYKEYI